MYSACSMMYQWLWLALSLEGLHMSTDMYMRECQALDGIDECLIGTPHSKHRVDTCIYRCIVSCLTQETGGRGAVQAIQIRGSGSGSDNWTPMQNVWGAEWVSVLGHAHLSHTGRCRDAYRFIAVNDFPSRLTACLHRCRRSRPAIRLVPSLSASCRTRVVR
jgi:Expansin C-terminal domain